MVEIDCCKMVFIQSMHCWIKPGLQLIFYRIVNVNHAWNEDDIHNGKSRDSIVGIFTSIPTMESQLLVHNRNNVQIPISAQIYSNLNISIVRP